MTDILFKYKKIELKSSIKFLQLVKYWFLKVEKLI